MTQRASMEEQAQEFAEDVAMSLSAFLGRDVRVVARSRVTKVVIEPNEGDTLTMAVCGRPLLSIEVSFRCRFDHLNQYLAVETSTFKVHGGARPKGDPLFRFEYVYAQRAHLPAAHLHVHAHRDQLTHVMTLAAEAGAKHRQPDKSDSVEVARMSSLHFPLGGHRFRPALEDVLQMMRTEFGVDVGPDWEDRLGQARIAYRRKQTASAVRDSPAEAARVLGELGYQVTDPEGGPVADRIQRLAAF